MTALSNSYFNPVVFNFCFELIENNEIFCPLNDLTAKKAFLLNRCRFYGIKGTILLAPEGLNVNLAGQEESLRALVAEFASRDWLKGLVFKESWADSIPFNKMLVRIKKEIIAFDRSLHQHTYTRHQAIDAETLKDWYDRGVDFNILDTRNDYETKIGSFKNAHLPPIRTFKEFSSYVEAAGLDRDKPLVTFCTGGVRCEKAAPMMAELGFKNVLQLDGGILKYFEKCGASHYEGDCFVFDQRVALKPDLTPNGMIQCFACRMPLTAQ